MPVTMIMNATSPRPERVVAEMAERLPETRRWPGNRSIELHRSIDDPSALAWISTWDDRASIDAYFAWRTETGRFAELVAMLDGAPTFTVWEQADTTRRVLMVLTSHDQLGDTGNETGWYLPEAAHPWAEFCVAGFAVDFVSPKGGYGNVIGVDLTDERQAAFLHAYGPQGPDSMTPDQIDPTRYDAVFYVGGHGTMWDLPDAMGIAKIAASVYDDGGVVAAVCHGPAGLINITTADGQPLVAGKRFAAFTDSEERAVGLDGVIPFFLSKQLTARGGTHVPAPDFAEQVIVDGRLVTGQNPASATGVAAGVVGALAPIA
jgi:putative intracellular protease/amidase/quinol monooxygenase YgiN